MGGNSGSVCACCLDFTGVREIACEPPTLVRRELFPSAEGHALYLMQPFAALLLTLQRRSGDWVAGVLCATVNVVGNKLGLPVHGRVLLF
jgi:hypothetical protein